MNKHHFYLLLSKYRNGDCTEQEERLVEQWFVLIGGKKSNHSVEDYQQVEEKIWNAIKNEKPILIHAEKQQGQVLQLWRWVAAAAVLLGLLWGGWQLTKDSFSDKQHEMASVYPAGLITKTNKTDHAIWVSLNDGSRVSLSPEASVKYPEKFSGNKREVFLNGRAFFEVVKNPDRPFMVHSEEVTTRVLGTSFWVDMNQSNAIEVSVVTGKVSVFQDNNADKNSRGKMTNGVIITPNQKVKYMRESEVFVTSLVEYPIMDSAYEKAFVFDDSPISKVVDLMEKAYGVEVVLENEKTNSCLFTADIGKLPMYTKLDLICASINAHYEVRGTKILISKGRCKE